MFQAFVPEVLSSAYSLSAQGIPTTPTLTEGDDARGIATGIPESFTRDISSCSRRYEISLFRQVPSWPTSVSR